MIQSGAEQYQPSDEDAARAASGRKNTRRWCKGKPGREHTPQIQLDPTLAFLSMPCSDDRFPGCKHHLVCATCGKVLAPSLQRIVQDQCPDLHPEATR